MKRVMRTPNLLLSSSERRKDRVHRVESAVVAGTMLTLRVDDKAYQVDLAAQSARLA